MGRLDTTVELPIGNPGDTAKLLGKIAARNTTLGVDSPIQNDFDWVGIGTTVTDLTQLVKDAIAADRKAQSFHYKALSLLGTAPNQNLQSPDTLHPLITKVRDILLVKNQTNPEELSNWGFNVVVDTTGGKRTVVVEIPLESPTDLIQLCKDIVEQHTTLGVSSPLNGKIDMTFFSTTTDAAESNFTKGEEERGKSETKNAQAMTMAGYGPGQNSETPGTCYNLLCNMRDLLLVAHSKTPKELTDWGFHVVVGETAYHPQDDPKPEPDPVP